MEDDGGNPGGVWGDGGTPDSVDDPGSVRRDGVTGGEIDATGCGGAPPRGGLGLEDEEEVAVVGR